MKTYFKLIELFAHCSEEEIKFALMTRSVSNSLSMLLVLLNRLRNIYGDCIIVNSGYRDKEHNLRVGGVPSSQHCKGEAVDIAVASKDYKPILKCIVVLAKAMLVFKDDDDFPKIGQVIVYLDKDENLRFIHLALADKEHPYPQYLKHFNNSYSKLDLTNI